MNDEVVVPPGAPGQVLRVVTAFRGVADDIDHLELTMSTLETQTGSEMWKGPAAVAFRDLLADISPKLKRMAEAHRAASEALHTYERVLDARQLDAIDAKFDADKARGDRDAALRAQGDAQRDADAWSRSVSSAEDRHRQADRRRGESPDPAYQAYLDHYQAEASAEADEARARKGAALDRATTAGTTANQADGVVAAKALLARQAAQMIDMAGRTAATSIKAAAGEAPKPPNRVQRFVADLDRAGRKFFAEHDVMRWMNIVSDVGSVLLAVSEIARYVPLPYFSAAAAVFAVGGIAAKGVALAGTALAAHYGQATKTQVAMRAADTGLSVFGARKVFNAAKNAEQASKVVRFFGVNRPALRSADKVSEAFKVPSRAPSWVTPERYFRASVVAEVGSKTLNLWDAGTSLSKDISDLGRAEDQSNDIAADGAGTVTGQAVESMSERAIGGGSRSAFASAAAEQGAKWLIGKGAP